MVRPRRERRRSAPGPGARSTYEFDDLYRLTAATTRPATWTYRYDDAGNLTFKSDVGDYRYGEGGAPATCLTSAGTGDALLLHRTRRDHHRPLGVERLRRAAGRLVSITSGVTQTFRYNHTGLRAFATGGGHTRLTPDPLFAIEDGDLVLNLFDGVGVAGLRPPTATPSTSIPTT